MQQPPPPCSRVCSAGAPSPGQVLCVCGVRNTSGKSTVECVQCCCWSHIQCARLTLRTAKQSRFLCHRCRPAATTKGKKGGAQGQNWSNPVYTDPRVIVLVLFLSAAPCLPRFGEALWYQPPPVQQLITPHPPLPAHLPPRSPSLNLPPQPAALPLSPTPLPSPRTPVSLFPPGCH